MARVAVGGFQHETNTFSPQKATFDDFARADAWPPLVRGQEMIEAVNGFNIPIAGAVEFLKSAGHQLVPLSWASAPPSAHVTEDAYERIAGMIEEDLRKAMPVDGVYLDLHGAMVTEHYQDGEGELLRRLRAVVGPDIPIVTSLDYHTNMTPTMVANATAMIGYRTYPHVDMADTGKRAAELLDKLLRDKRPLYKAFRQLDFLIPIVWQCTMNEPAASLIRLVEEMESSGGTHHNYNLASLTLTPGFPPADIEHCGPALVVYGYDKANVEAAADKLAAAVAAQEAKFEGEILEPDAAVKKALEIARGATKPVVLADVQDNPGAGGTSDTVGLLLALMRHKAKGAVIGLIVDEDAANAALQAGEGAVMERGIGAVLGVGGEKPAFAKWRVAKVASGNFTCTGPFYGGARMHLGPMALVTDTESGVSAVLACRRVQMADQDMFRHVGVEPGKAPILGVKSSVHFRADFQPIAVQVLVVRSPGAHITDPTELTYRNLRAGLRMKPQGPVFAGAAR